MRALTFKLPFWAAALWWGSLSTIGFLVVPLLFAYLPTPAMAGAMAARLFTAQTWVSLACGVLLLLAAHPRDEDPGEAPAHAARLYVVSGLFVAVLLEFVVAPRIVARENLALWHRVGSVMYLVQWLCATMTLRKVLIDRSRSS